MKFAVLTIAGALGMGLGSIARAVDRHGSDSEFILIISGLVMVIGLLGTIFPELAPWWQGREK